ncbi:MAG: ABC transporter ATP-binding protein [Lachnospiraceae bacterium]|nr:ABC transporter ATP-binding protein [Lachnospiraceae bacterium]
MSDTNDNIIHISGVDHSYRKNHVLKDLSIDLPLGESIAVLGANGSGKSTLLSILSGTRQCKGAKMVLNGSDLFKDKAAHRKLIGYVPQNDPLLDELSVRDNLLLWYKGPAKELDAALSVPAVEMLGVRDMLKMRVRSLSGGMRKKVSIATALINNPQVLILDEPAAALDLSVKAQIREYLEAFHSAGGTLILTTHDEEDLSIITLLYLIKGGSANRCERVLRGDELLHAIRGDSDAL